MEHDGLIITDDGSHSIQSEQFGVSYHSRHGAVQETLHVFINAALKPLAVKKQSLSILDIGFGTGLNAFASLIESQKHSIYINYTAVEAFPLTFSVIEQLNYASQMGVPELQNTFFQMHQQAWNQPEQLSDQFKLTKLLQKFETLDFHNAFDIVFYDAFAPNAQPELWDTPMMERMFQSLKMGGVLTTYCAKGAFKRTLKAVGFIVEAIPGPPGKREMTRAWKR